MLICDNIAALVTPVRIRTVKRGILGSWIKLFNERFVPASVSYGVKVIGARVNRPRNEFIWVRTFEDRLAG